MEAEASKKRDRYALGVGIAISLLAALAFYFSTNPTLHDLDYTAEIASALLRGDLGLRQRPYDLERLRHYRRWVHPGIGDSSSED